MKREQFLKKSTAVAAAVVISSLPSCGTESKGLKKGEIQHTVMFNLATEKDSEQTKRFLDDAKRILSAISTVNDFQVYTQVSPKNNFTYYFTMVFENQEGYDAYNIHPDHVDFVNNRWLKEVTEFQEADFIAE